MTGIIMASQKPSGETEMKGEQGQEDHALVAASEAMISAMHAKDATALAKAFREAMAVCDDDQGPEAA